jgi:cytochrome d ubiquinol oxidase subunit I
MRVMAYAAVLILLLGLWGLWLMRRHKLETSRRFLWLATWAVVLPFIMNTAGWMLTENGRQPWIVQGLMLTRDGVSPSVGTSAIVTSLIIFFLLYLVLVIVDLVLMLRYARRELPPAPAEAAGEPPVPAAIQ